MNICNECGNEYVPHNTAIYQVFCSRTCRDRARNKRADEKKKNMLAEYKISRGCADCGYNKHPAALHFDHLPGTDKLFSLAQAHAHGWPAIQAEIDKCEVVCANCHAERTAGRAGWATRAEAVQLSLI